MNNNIQEDYVSFEVAKLLKEKGFACKTLLYYQSNGNRFFTKVENNFNNVDLICSAPTIALAVKWLHENFTIWITVEPTDGFWKFIIFSKEVTRVENLTRAFHSSPQEAYQAALEYTLKNLI